MIIANSVINGLGVLTIVFSFFFIFECMIMHLIDRQEKGEKYGK